jgi:hypothetical protein
MTQKLEVKESSIIRVLEEEKSLTIRELTMMRAALLEANERIADLEAELAKSKKPVLSVADESATG